MLTRPEAPERAAPMPPPAGKKRRKKTPSRGGRPSFAGQRPPESLYLLDTFLLRSNLMAHKKIERAKELDRRRHRRAQRIKERIHEAKAAAAKK